MICHQRVADARKALETLTWEEMDELAQALIRAFEKRSKDHLPGGTRLASFRSNDLASDLLMAIRTLNEKGNRPKEMLP